MANTLKFGNGQWATKVGSTLAYNDEGGNFKPLPFNFTRSTSGTRVNKDGLIEVVTNNKPRIDFKDDSNGALLLEPSRSNINTFSDPTDAQKGSLSYASVTYQDNFNWGLGNVIENAIVFGDNSTTRYAYYSSAVSSGASYSLSFFVKMDDNSVPIPATDFLLVLAGTSIASGYTIDNYGNNVYRVSVSGTAGASNTANGILKVASHSAKTFKISGFQIEAGSYATSYIPTQGAISTRVAEVCIDAGNNQVINSTEGVLFAEIKPITDDYINDAGTVISSQFNLSDGNLNNGVNIRFRKTVLQCLYYNGSAYEAVLTYTDISVSETYKVAFLYKQNDFKMYVNGVLIASDTNGSIGSFTLDRLTFDNSNGVNPFYGNVKDLRVYNTALTDQELINLTTI